MKRDNSARAQRVIEAGVRSAKTKDGANRIGEILLYERYAEPDYNDPTSGIVALGNWNAVGHWDEATNEHVIDDDTIGRVATCLESIGVELQWSDEWVSCDCCNKIFRCVANSYRWQQAGVIEDGAAVCEECIDPKKHLKALENKHRRCNTIESINPAEHGYISVNGTFQNGLYGGQSDDPKLIAQSMRKAGFTRFLFNLDHAGQFDIGFSLWLHRSEKRKLKLAEEALQQGPTQGVDPAEVCRRYLEDAGRRMDQLAGAGVKVATMNEDGTANVRLVSPKDFIKGGALK